MHYGQARSFSPNLIRVSANFTRPADTTAYTSGDLVANSVTAASVVPLSWTVSRTVLGLVRVRRALLHKNQNSITNAGFQLHLFNASPTIATAGDNSVFATNVSGYDKSMGFIEFTSIARYADGAVSQGQCVDDTNTKAAAMIVAPAAGRLVYGLLLATGAYTPASAEVFTVDLELERA